MVANNPMPVIEYDKLNDGRIFKTWLDKYKKPYDKNTFNTTIMTISLKTLPLNTLLKSDLSGKSSLSLYIKYNISTRYIQNESMWTISNTFKKYWTKNKEIIKDNTSFKRIFFNFSLNKDILSKNKYLYTLI